MGTAPRWSRAAFVAAASVRMDFSSLHDYVIAGDNLAVLADLGDGTIPLIYIDPPFNTGRTQRRTTLRPRKTTPATVLGSAAALSHRLSPPRWSTPMYSTTTWPSSEPRIREAHRC